MRLLEWMDRVSNISWQGRDNIRLRLVHLVDKVHFALSNLNNFLNETSSNLLLNLGNPRSTLVTATPESNRFVSQG